MAEQTERDGAVNCEEKYEAKTGKAIRAITIIGQIEGHYVLDSTQKATKYDHLIPLLVALEESERIDGVLSHVYHLSRSDAAELFRAGKVFLNSRTVSSGSTVLKSGDIVSLRGTGRFRYQGPQRTTKSGKLSVVVELYR